MWHGPLLSGFFMIFPMMFLIFFIFFLMSRAGRWGFRAGCGGMRGRRMKPSAKETLI